MVAFDNSRWDTAKVAEAAIHKIHSYPARFPAFIVEEALKYAEEQGVEVESIADVFCGCGTTAVESKKNDKNFWGWDVNPVAALITKVKCGNYKDTTLEKYYEKIINCFLNLELNEREVEGINERIKYWFDGDHIRDLLKLKKSIYQEAGMSPFYRNFFLCAFSNILKPTSKWLSKSIKPQIDPIKTPADTLSIFQMQVEKMRKATAGKQYKSEKKSKVEVKVANFLATSKKTPLVDLVVTSPPYVTSYDYADLHQLSLLWLDYLQDYRNLRKNMIGNRYGLDSVLESEIMDLPSLAQETWKRLAETDKNKANSVVKYFRDIEKSVSNCWNILKPRGMAVFIIGNTEYRSVKIDNAKYLSQCMENAGFERIEEINRKMSMKTLTPYRDSNGRFTKCSEQRQVYAREFVAIGRKA